MEDTRERVLLSGDLPSPANPPSGCSFHTHCPWRQATRCDEERPQLRTVELPGVPGNHRVACHWAEDIEAGKITAREVTPQATDPTEEQGDGAVAGTANTVAELG
ncbi:oligopeptide/dipeptide ABC transporter ATP-binding protein [Bogoriella caseilytica]|uniref:oligopeptide/dipeptide ABC transporter ATP-binding protein n=1 Tax=Bogoriella caseilytica TaxID=56055 RepID=UPI0026D60DAF